MKKRFQAALALTIFIAIVSILGSSFFVLITGKDFIEAYFTKDFLFYELLIVFAGVFVLTFLFWQPKDKLKD